MTSMYSNMNLTFESLKIMTDWELPLTALAVGAIISTRVRVWLQKRNRGRQHLEDDTVKKLTQQCKEIPFIGISNTITYSFVEQIKSN